MGEDTAPRITVKPSLQQLDNGNKLKFSCEIEASPKPEIKWYKENTLIVDSDRLKSNMEDKDSKNFILNLEIDNLTSDDSGQYKVVAKNFLGEVSASIALNFAAETAQTAPQDGIAPNFTQKPLIKPDADGKRLCFECKLKADPEPEILWYRDNEEIVNKGRHLIYCDKLPDNMFFVCLEIDDVNIVDAGKYRVTAKNNLGESNASITLNFDSEDSGAGSSGGNPIFIQKPFIRQLEDKIFFECKLTADPVPKFTWYLENSVLKNPTKYKQRILSEGNSHTLILEINNLGSKDSGDYKVVAKNSKGEADANIKLNIDTKKSARLPDGIAPNFISKPMVTQTQELLLIQLELKANPTPSVSWYLDNKDLQDVDSRYNTKIEKISPDSFLLSLEIKEPKNKDKGLYKCDVVNELGECIANIHLQFQGDAAGLDKGDQIAPSIIEKPKIIKDEAKKTVRFECKLRAKPEAKIKWLKEKTDLANGKKYKIETKKDTTTENVFILILEISDFSPEDGGLYKVQATNESGQSNANIHLNVEIQEKSPNFIGKPRILKENKGQRIVFECDCESGKAPEIIWSKNGLVIANQGRFLIDIDASQKSHFVIILEIDNIQAEDEGAYRCEASTSAGSSFVNVDLKLNKDEPAESNKKPEEAAKPPKAAAAAPVAAPVQTVQAGDKADFKEKPKDQVGVDGDRIVVSCKVIGTPKPEITWMKKNQPIKKSKDFDMEFNGEIAKLIIKDAYTEDTGDYSCEVWNELGSQTASFKITIKEKKGKPKRSRPVPKAADLKKDEDETRKEKRKSDAAKAPQIEVKEAAKKAPKEDEPNDDSRPSSRRNSQAERRQSTLLKQNNDDQSLKVRRDSKSRRTSLAELIPDWPTLTKRKVGTKNSTEENPFGIEKRPSVTDQPRPSMSEHRPSVVEGLRSLPKKPARPKSPEPKIEIPVLKHISGKKKVK
jgi:hypothetical protein